MKPIISVEGLGKSYTIRHEGQTHYKSLREEIFKLPSRLLRRGGQSREEFWALKDVSFNIMPGDRVGIIGRNGAGKSTLLKLLSRITEPTTGRITLRGRVASLLEVGTGFHPELTGRENIYLNGAILGMSRAEVRRKFDEIVDFAGVEKFLDTPVKRYSSGMYVRLAFAVAAHLEPEILIVDEVLAVGDMDFQKKCLGKMDEVGKSGRTVIFVSHNMSAIHQLCSRGFLVGNGSLVMDASVEEAVANYINWGEQNNALKFDVSEKEDDTVKFLSVFIHQDENINQSVIDIAKETSIVIEYEILKEVLGFRIHVDICNNSGQLLVRSFSTDFDDSIKVLLPGKYISTLKIPAYFLGPITYSIGIHSSIFNVKYCAGEMQSIINTVCSGNWCGPYTNDVFRGQILAHLPWITTRNGEGNAC